MAHVSLILLDDVEKLGLAGDEVHVAPGYARNYLIPRGLAAKATPGTLRLIESRKAIIAARRQQELADAQALAAKLAEIELSIPMQATEDEQLFGSVTNRMIADLLAAQGIITVRDGAGLTATVNDIEENPHNVKIEEIEAAQLPRTVADVDFAVINGNYAMEAGFSVGTDALAIEDASSEAAQTYANVLVVKEGNENDPAIQALYAALTSDTIKDFINNTYDGAVVPIF